MESNEESVGTKTLIDAIGEPAVPQTPTAVPSPSTNGIRVSEGFDLMSTPANEGGVATVDTSIRLGLAGPEIGLDGPLGNSGVPPVSLVGTVESGEKGNIDAKSTGSAFAVGSNGDGVKSSSQVSNRDAAIEADREIEGDDTANAGESRIEYLDRHASLEIDGEIEGYDTGDYMEEHGYSVGDLVWGKIKSHPWWPGQICDPSDASDVATKYNQKGRLLVAYFGDGTFAWCLPSQLIPFAENFEEMSKQNSSRNFASAVSEAVDEIGRLVDLEMTCSCVPAENRKALSRVPVVNAGIKTGALAPEGDIGKLLSFRYDPAELLATVANTAESLSFPSVLELSILKGWLSSFYRARGGYSLPVYHGPFPVEGLEDKLLVGAHDLSPTEVPHQDPLEEGLASSTAAGPGNGPAPEGEKIHHSRKQKSVAELLAAGTEAIPKNPKSKNSGSGRSVSTSATKKRKINEEDLNHSDRVQDVPTGKGRGPKDKQKISETEIDISSEEKTQEGSLPGKLDKVDIPAGGEGGDTRGYKEMSSPRERKKSKYLSPPYARPRSRAGYPSYEDEERDSEKVTRIARVGDRMTKAAEKLLDATPSKHGGATAEEHFSGGDSGEHTVESADLIPQTGRIVYAANANATVEEILSGLKSIAVDTQFLRNSEILLLIREFISAFRSSVYLTLESDEAYHRTKRGRKTKSLDSEHENLVDDLNRSGTGLLASKTTGKKHKNNSRIAEKSGKERSDTPKPKKAIRGSRKAILEGIERKDPLRCSLVLTFAPGFLLPEKDEIVNVFSKFGNIKESETDSNSGNVRIVYLDSACAEAALRASLSQNLFGSTPVEYNLCYSSDAPVAVEMDASDRPVSGPASEGMPQRSSIRQKLETMTSMLEKCEGKVSTQVMSSLDDEVNSLFDKVRQSLEKLS